MRGAPAAVLAFAAVCACAGGPALAAAAGGTTTATVTGTTTATVTDTTTSPVTTTTAAPSYRACLASARRVIAAGLGVRVAKIAEHQRLASNGMPQCNYVVPRAGRGGPHAKVVVTANVDNGPQAGWRLMRKVVEAGQIFGPIPPGWKPPSGVRGLGPYASWFPNLDQLMATNLNRRYLITVGIIWRRAKRPEMIGLARATIRPYRRMRRFTA